MKNLKEKGVDNLSNKKSFWEEMGLIPEGTSPDKKLKAIEVFDSIAEYFDKNEVTTVSFHEGTTCLEVFVFPLAFRTILANKWPKNLTGYDLCKKLVKYPLEKIPMFGKDVDAEAEFCAWCANHINDITR